MEENDCDSIVKKKKKIIERWKSSDEMLNYKVNE